MTIWPSKQKRKHIPVYDKPFHEIKKIYRPWRSWFVWSDTRLLINLPCSECVKYFHIKSTSMNYFYTNIQCLACVKKQILLVQAWYQILLLKFCWRLRFECYFLNYDESVGYGYLYSTYSNTFFVWKVNIFPAKFNIICLIDIDILNLIMFIQTQRIDLLYHKTKTTSNVKIKYPVH